MCDTSPLSNLSVMTNGLRRRSLLALPLVVPLLAAGSLSLRVATPAETERKIEALLAKMTLQEKLGQMSQAVLRDLSDMTKEEIRQGRWGSLFGGGTPIQLTAAIPGLGAGVVTIEAKAAPRPELQ